MAPNISGSPGRNSLFVKHAVSITFRWLLNFYKTVPLSVKQKAPVTENRNFTQSDQTLSVTGAEIFSNLFAAQRYSVSDKMLAVLMQSLKDVLQKNITQLFKYIDCVQHS